MHLLKGPRDHRGDRHGNTVRGDVLGQRRTGEPGLTWGGPLFFLQQQTNLFPKENPAPLFTTFQTPNVQDVIPHTKQFSSSLWARNSVSDINCLELAQTPQVKGSVPQDCCPFQMPVASIECPGTTVLSDSATSGIPRTSSSSSIIYYYGSKNSGKLLF